MLTITYYIVALLLLSLLVTVHELGHYTAGRLLGFSIVEFSVGMGPRIMKVERKGIIYSLKALPIGGSCQFVGEDEVAIDKKDFNAMPRWRRAVVLFAGPALNFLFALVLCVIMFTVYGSTEADMSRVFVAGVNEGSRAEIAGVLKGDEILSVNGVAITQYDELRPLLDKAENGTAVIGLEREGKPVTLTLTNMYNTAEGRNMMGVTTDCGRITTHYTFFESFGESFRFMGKMVGAMLDFFRMLFTGGIKADDVAGPVGIVTMIATFAPQGMEVVLQLAILLSVNLGFMNLLPLPALDGGRLVFVGIHAIFRRRVPVDIEARIHAVGLFLLFGLILFITILDITRCFGG